MKEVIEVIEKELVLDVCGYDKNKVILSIDKEETEALYTYQLADNITDGIVSHIKLLLDDADFNMNVNVEEDKDDVVIISVVRK